MVFTMLIYWRRQWQPTPVLLPGKSHGRRSLVGCSPGGHWESDTTKWLPTFTFHFHALEKEMANHSSDLAWRIPGTGEPGRLPSMGWHRVRHDWSDLAAGAAAYQYTFLLCLLSGEFFIINGCWILLKTFSVSVEMTVWLLSFNLLIWCIFIDLHLLKNPCIPGINSTWSLCMTLLMCCWILFVRILLRIFASVFISYVLSCSVMSDSLLPHRL